MAPVLLIVGVGRSGTTSIYDAAARHRATVWLSEVESRYDVRLPRLLKAYNLRLAGTRSRRWRHALAPSEAYGWWDRLWPGREWSDEVVREEIERRAGGRVFINKNTRNTRRIAELSSALPNARFVLVVRHPAAVCASLVRVAWWPRLQLWTRGGALPGDLASSRTEHLALAAELWYEEMRVAEASLRGTSHAVVRYEDFVADTTSALQRVWRLADLGDDVRAIRLAAARVHAAAAQRWRDELTHEELGIIASKVCDAARPFGYDFP